jgi:hypothetical protein
MGEAGLLDRSMGNTKFSIIFALYDNGPAHNPQQFPGEAHLAFNGDFCFYLYITSCKHLKITFFSQRPIRSRRRDFEGIGTVNRIFRVKEPADGLAHAGAIFHGDPFFPVDIVSNQGPSAPPANFDLDKGQAEKIAGLFA